MMQGTYYKEWSSVLNREMEFQGILAAPVCGAGSAAALALFDWENNGMPDAIASC